MKNKNVNRTHRDVRNNSGSVLRQLHFHLQNYLEALKSLNENNEYHNLTR